MDDVTTLLNDNHLHNQGEMYRTWPQTSWEVRVMLRGYLLIAMTLVVLHKVWYIIYVILSVI